MRKIILITLMLFTASSYAQVGINTNTPNASSALEIESTTGGILIPRMKETQRDAIVSPVAGLMIYQTDEISGFYFYNGTAWTKIDGVAGPAGPQGNQGAPGPAGVDGQDGADGAQGVQGDQGIQGETGTQGPIGSTGSIGAAGPAGADGAQGPIGPAGADADTSEIAALSDIINNDQAAPSLTIGDYIGGGIVFWVDPNDATQGLVCAVDNQSTGIQWYNGVYTVTGASGTAIGTGAANTTAIISAQGLTEVNYAAGLARAHNGGGFTDWFLPSKDALHHIYTNRVTINTKAVENGGAASFTNGYYWTSTQSGSNVAAYQHFANGSQYYIDTNASFYVRAVRAVSSLATSSLSTITSEQIDQNTAIDLKANIASPTFTGTVTIPTLIASGNTYPNTDGENGQVLATDGSGTLSWTTPSSGATTYNVGDTAQGGKVFWVDATGQHGLVVAVEDSGGSLVMDWNAGTASNGLNLETLAQSNGIYAGKMNTAIIIAAHASAANNGNNFAARACNEYRYTQNGVDYGDWYLPSKDELHLIKTSGAGVPNLYAYNYWSSTEHDADNAYAEVLGNYANNYNQFKPKDTAEGIKVRAIRSF